MGEPTALRERIPLLRSAVDIAELSGGSSSDRLYVVTDATDGRRLLRVTHLAERNRLDREFSILRLLQQHQVKTPRPLELGVLEDVRICYAVFSYLDGQSAARALAACSGSLQYALGREGADACGPGTGGHPGVVRAARREAPSRHGGIQGVWVSVSA